MPIHFQIVPRRWWSASPPMHTQDLQLPVSQVYFTYSKIRNCYTTSVCSQEVKRIQSRHIFNGAVDVVYNFLIGGNGEIFEGRGWHTCPKLNQNHQRFARNSLFVSFIGDFKHTLPSDAMFDSAQKLLVFGVKKGFISERFLEFSTKLWTAPVIDHSNEVLSKVLI